MRDAEVRIAKWLGFKLTQNQYDTWYCDYEPAHYHMSDHYKKLQTEEEAWEYLAPHFSKQWQDHGLLWDALSAYHWQPLLSSNMLVHTSTLHANINGKLTVFQRQDVHPLVAFVKVVDEVVALGLEFERNRNFIEDSLSEREH